MAQTPDDFAVQIKAAVEKMTPPLARVGIIFEAVSDIPAEVTEMAGNAVASGLLYLSPSENLEALAIKAIQLNIEYLRLLRAEAAKS